MSFIKKEKDQIIPRLAFSSLFSWIKDIEVAKKFVSAWLKGIERTNRKINERRSKMKIDEKEGSA